MKAYHFTSSTLRDGSPIPRIGEELRYNGHIVICQSGLHASKDPFDALQYAPGQYLHLVECKEIKEKHNDKFVCASRTIIKTIDSTELLKKFARYCALSVVHLWNPPQVVLDFLNTGAEELRAAARGAAWAATRAAARGAARDAARDAAWDAARGAARDAARGAAWAAARGAAWDAARAAARGAQRKEFNKMAKEAFK